MLIIDFLQRECMFKKIINLHFPVMLLFLFVSENQLRIIKYATFFNRKFNLIFIFILLNKVIRLLKRKPINHVRSLNISAIVQ